MDGDVDAAIEFIIADQVSEESFFENDGVSFSESTSHGNDRSVHIFHKLTRYFGLNITLQIGSIFLFKYKTRNHCLLFSHTHTHII